jgi:hypothetical protein
MPECVSAETRIIGSRQYPPRMMLALVIYCYANGTHIKANASKHKGVRYDRAGDLEEKLRQDIEELRGWDGTGEAGAGPTAGASDPPQPKHSQQINLTDPDSALMRKSRRDSYEQAYNVTRKTDDASAPR